MKPEGTKIEGNCPPVLFIVFNRPDITKRVFQRIREVQPPKIFIAADGPRPNVLADKKLCEQTRQVVELIDWECEIHRLYRETNLGCKQGVSTAITWFFDHIEAGIILEDDCLPNPTFFSFCDELLERYRDDERIMLISGNNFQQGEKRTSCSYYFSKYIQIWGWATWRRAWKHYDGNLTYWPILRDTPWLMDIHGNVDAENYWRKNFSDIYAGKIDTWDYSWTYSCWIQNGLAILPEINLVSNIGFDERATHTKTLRREVMNLPTKLMKFPLQHPPFVIRHSEADLYTFTTILRSSPKARKLFQMQLFQLLINKMLEFTNRIKFIFRRIYKKTNQ